MQLEDQGITPDVDLTQEDAPKSMDDTIGDTLRSLQSAEENTAAASNPDAAAGAIEDPEAATARIRAAAGNFAAKPVEGAAPADAAAPSAADPAGCIGRPAIVTGQKERVGAWVGARIGNAQPWNDYQAIGLERNGRLVGGVVIDNYIVGARCSVHCAGVGRHWLNREFLRIVFDYAFRQLRCQAIVNIVAGCNADSLRFTAHLGFREVHRIRGGGRDGSDGVIFEMQKSRCKWVTPRSIE